MQNSINEEIKKKKKGKLQKQENYKTSSLIKQQTTKKIIYRIVIKTI